MKIISFPRLQFERRVFEQVRKTIGSFAAEMGGVLGGNPQTGKISRFFFDRDARSSSTTYSVNAERINPVIARWNQEGLHLLGMVHSHPPGCELPSAADIEFARRILSRPGNGEMNHLVIPIIQSDMDSTNRNAAGYSDR